MGKPWLKLWTDTLSDRKLRRLDPAEKWCWVGLLLLAAETDDAGRIEIADGVPMAGEDFMDALDVEPEIWDHAYRYFLRMGMIAVDGNGFVVVVNYAKRQEPKDPTAAERMRRYRDKGRTSKPVTLDVTRNVTPVLRVEVEVEAEADKEPVCVITTVDGGQHPAPTTTNTHAQLVTQGDADVTQSNAPDRVSIPYQAQNTHTQEKPPAIAFASDGRTDEQKRVMQAFQDTTGQTIWSSPKKVQWLDEMTSSAGEERMKAIITELGTEIRAGTLIAYNALGAISERLKASQNGIKAPAARKDGRSPILQNDPHAKGVTATVIEL